MYLDKTCRHTASLCLDDRLLFAKHLWTSCTVIHVKPSGRHSRMLRNCFRMFQGFMAVPCNPTVSHLLWHQGWSSKYLHSWLVCRGRSTILTAKFKLCGWETNAETIEHIGQCLPWSETLSSDGKPPSQSGLRSTTQWISCWHPILCSSMFLRAQMCTTYTLYKCLTV